MNERWEEKCSSRNDVLCAWLLVLMVLAGMNLLLSLAGPEVYPSERSSTARSDISSATTYQAELSREAMRTSTRR